jgi:mono/diheme cytochrome c family protein
MNMRPFRALIVGPWVLWILSACVSTPRDSVDWGRRLAQSNCARCHAVGAQGKSPNAFAPEFRNLSQTYSRASIEETFTSGDIAEHPPMPHFADRPDDNRDILNYIKSVQTTLAEP